MLDVPLRLTVELGRAELPLAEVLALKPGSVVELDRFPGEPLDMYANGRLVARGEIIVLNDIFGFRVTEIPNTAAEMAAGASLPPAGD
jgi:flagellar motor switch protein FliN/FliY